MSPYSCKYETYIRTGRRRIAWKHKQIRLTGEVVTVVEVVAGSEGATGLEVKRGLRRQAGRKGRCGKMPDQHDENCEQAAAVAKKNMESTFCFGTDSPAMPKRVQKPAAAPVQEPVASPATTARIRGDMRHKMLEGDDSAFAWESGEPDDRMRNHAPLHPNPEIHVKGRDENRRANNTTHFTIGSDSPAATPMLGSKIPASVARRIHGTTKAEAARLATRLAVASPHTMKQREMGEHVESFNSAAYNTASPVAPVHVGAAFKSNLVLGTSDSPMQTHESRAKASCVVNDSTEQNREALSSIYLNNKANFEKVTLEFC